MNAKTFRFEDGNELTVEILIGFKVEELNKEYIAYTLNDDNVSDTVKVMINEVVYNGDVPELRGIPEEEKERVIEIYNGVKNNI